MDSFWTDSDGWPMTLLANLKNVSVSCSRPKDTSINKAEWTNTLKKLTNRLGQLQKINVPGHIAVSCVLCEFPLVKEQNGIQSIAYVQDNSDEPVYTWPKISSEKFIASSQNDFSHLPFGNHKWKSIDVYYGNFGTVGTVEFQPKNCLFVGKYDNIEQWFVLLEAYVSEHYNDAVLQKMPLVEVFPDQTYKAYDWESYLENAAGGGDYDWVISNPTVSARGDIIANLPNHPKFTETGTRNRYVVIVLDESRKTFRQVGSFLSTDPELIAARAEIDDTIKKGSGSTFEIIDDVLTSHDFSNIQLNVKNMFSESNIITFKNLHTGTGHIIECKQYGNSKNRVSLREAHVLATKTISSKKYSIDKGVLVTTGDLTRPIRNFYDDIWDLESRAHDEVIGWLRTFKSLKDGIYF